MRITDSHLRKLIREFLSNYASRRGAQSNLYTDFTRQELAKPVGLAKIHAADEEIEDETCPACRGKGTLMGRQCKMCQGTGEYSHSAEE